MARSIARQTYVKFMKRYKLKIMKRVDNKYKYKTMVEMSKEIYNYETNNDNVMEGLYYVK